MERETNRKFLLLVIILLITMVIFSGWTHPTAETIQQLQNINGHVIQSLRDIVINQRQPVPVSTQTALALKYDLLINSYMNSGSRFTGQLFGFRKEAFYIYEPLWKFSVWNYFHGDNLVCSSTQGSVNCSEGTVTNVNKMKDSRGCPTIHLIKNVSNQGIVININKMKDSRGCPTIPLVKNVSKNSTIVRMMLDVLDDMYNCDFSKIENLFVPNVQDRPDLAGPGWNEYRICTKSRANTKTSCLKKLEQKCKNASHIVTKVLRLTTGSYDTLLERRKNLKIIHLFRNPFAIVNSRTETKGYPVKDYNSNTAVLCKKIQLDYEGGIRLAAKYPGRVKLVFYEDIKSNVTEKLNKLYEFIGMEADDNELKKLNKVKTNKGKSNTLGMSRTRVSDNAHWWRSHMSFQRYQMVQDKCQQLMSIFNLTYFKDRKELMKLNRPEMKLPDHLRIK